MTTKEEFFNLLDSISNDLNFAKNHPELVKKPYFYENEKSGLPKLDRVQFKFLPVSFKYYIPVKFKIKNLYEFLWTEKNSVLEEFYNLYLLTSSESTVACYAGELGLMKNKFDIKYMLDNLKK